MSASTTTAVVPLEADRSPAARWLLAGARLNLSVCLLTFVLAFVFMSGGLAPGRVAAPMDGLLIYAPWHGYYPNVTPLLPASDPILQQLPWHQWVQDELRAGRFPLWVSGPLGGYNLFASAQSGVLFPLHLLWAFFPTGVGYGIIMALKLWLAGVGMWFFLRSMALRVSASLFGALGFMFSASMILMLPWANSAVYLMLPWLAWPVYVWSAHKRRAALVGLAAMLALTIFAGQPEVLFLAGISTGVWMLGLLLTSPFRDWPRQVAGWGVALLVGMLIGAIQLLPFIEQLQLSYVNALRQTGTGTASFYLDAGSMLYWILPRTWGQLSDGVLGGKDNIFNANAYVGLVALLGIVFAVIAALRRNLALRLVAPWAFLALFGWLTAYDSTLGQLIRNLPFFNETANARWVMVISFCVLVLGSLGWDWFAGIVEARAELSGWRSLGRWGVLGTCLLVAGVAILAAHLFGLIERPDMGQKPGTLVFPTDSYDLYWAIWAGGIALGIAGATLIWASGWRGRRIMPAVLSILLVSDLWMLLITFIQYAPAGHYFPTTSFISQLSVVPPTERILVEGENMPANTGLIYGVRDWRGQDPMIPARAHAAAAILDPAFVKTIWTDYNMFLDDPRLEVAPALGMRYFILPASHNPNYPLDASKPNFKRLAYKDGLGLWEAEGVPGYAYLSDNVWAVPDEPGASHWLLRLTWDKMRNYAAMVEAPDSTIAGMEHTTYTAGSGEPGSVTVAEYTPGHIVLDVSAARPSLLVVAESYYPGWRATIDDRPATILRANYLSQGLVMPQGKHTVEFSYEPDSFRYGALFSLVGLASLAGLGGWAILAAKRASATI